jgi:hypothetical protein
MPVNEERIYRLSLPRKPKSGLPIAFRTGAGTTPHDWHPYKNARDDVQEDNEITFTFDLDRTHCTECRDHMTVRRIRDQTKGVLEADSTSFAVKGKTPAVMLSPIKGGKP